MEELEERIMCAYITIAVTWKFPPNAVQAAFTFILTLAKQSIDLIAAKQLVNGKFTGTKIMLEANVKSTLICSKLLMRLPNVD